MKHTEVFNKWYSERMGHHLGIQLGKSAVDELEKENDKSKGQLKSLFERVSGCEVSEFDDEQVDYLADMIEGQMDADEGAISKLKKENAELIELTKEIGVTLSSYEFMKPSEKVVEIEKIKMAIDKLLNK